MLLTFLPEARDSAYWNIMFLIFSYVQVPMYRGWLMGVFPYYLSLAYICVCVYDESYIEKFLSKDDLKRKNLVYSEVVRWCYYWKKLWSTIIRGKEHEKKKRVPKNNNKNEKWKKETGFSKLELILSKNAIGLVGVVEFHNF